MQLLTISDFDRENISNNYATLCSPYDDYQKSLRQLYRVFSQLSENVLEDLFSFREDPTSPGALLLDNLPIDEVLPPTPVDGRARTGKTTFHSEFSLLGIAQLIGSPIGYRSEKGGEPIHHVIPVSGGEYTQSNEGSRSFLTYHNDSMYDHSMVFNSHNPDFILLLCVRTDPAGEAQTYYADARMVWDALDPALRTILREPRFKMAAPSNFTRYLSGNPVGERVWSHPVPIFSGPERFPEIYLAANGIEAIDPVAAQALDHLQKVCNTVGSQHSINLVPGQALAINNRKGVHARSPFVASYDGRDRWLMRANIRTNLWTIRDRATESAYVFH